jgi:hypothetical protein
VVTQGVQFRASDWTAGQFNVDMQIVAKGFSANNGVEFVADAGTREMTNFRLQGSRIEFPHAAYITQDGCRTNAGSPSGVLTPQFIGEQVFDTTNLVRYQGNATAANTDWVRLGEPRFAAIAPAQITANTDNYDPAGLATAKALRLSTDASRNLTGLVAQTNAPDGLLICNVGAQDLVLVHDATSTAANRFYCPGSVNFTLNANDSVGIWYDATVSRWRVLAA